MATIYEFVKINSRYVLWKLMQKELKETTPRLRLIKSKKILYNKRKENCNKGDYENL